jgi:SPP1 gp7 family putative phage head morphogenesis protein
MPNVYTQAAAFRAALIRRDAEAARRLTVAYDDVLANLNRELEKLIVKMEAARADGKEITRYWLSREERYKALIAQTKRELSFYAHGVGVLVDGRQAAELSWGALNAAALVEVAAGVNVGVAFNVLPTGAIENAIGALSADSPLRKLLVRDFAKEGADYIGAQLVKGVALGWNPRKIAREMRAAVELPLARAQTIARSEALRAYRISTLETYRAHSDIGTQYRWLASKSSRTCLNCLSRDGSLWPTSEIMPVHPNCRCTLIFVTQHTPPPRLTGAQWFEQQSDEVKRGMMPVSAFDLYKSGKIKLKDFEGYKDSRRWGVMTYQRSLREILSREKTQ